MTPHFNLDFRGKFLVARVNYVAERKNGQLVRTHWYAGNKYELVDGIWQAG
jgi:hypothetical protein